MTESGTPRTTRRGFLGSAAVAVAAPLLPHQLFNPPELTDVPALQVSSRYLSLRPAEAALTERLADVLCPADHLTPGGAACGLAMFIDRRLDGEFGRQPARGAWEHGDGTSYEQLPLTQAEFFKAGIAAVDRASRQRFGASFCELEASDASRLLNDIAAGRSVDAEVPLAAWFNQLVTPLLIRGSFSEPVYERYNNKVFWKLTHPGATTLSA
jgi:gluconate 2-dehydrogenase gamma chain